WLFRNQVTISNPAATTLTAFQVNVPLGSGFDFTKPRSDGGDIRFTDSDGVTLLPYWIEGWNAGSGSASVWVKVPTIPAAGTTIYLYYGNAAATTASNGSSTFNFFDDFESGVIDSGKWTPSGGAWTVVDDIQPNGTMGKVGLGITSGRQILESAFTGTD